MFQDLTFKHWIMRKTSRLISKLLNATTVNACQEISDAYLSGRTLSKYRLWRARMLIKIRLMTNDW